MPTKGRKMLNEEQKPPRHIDAAVVAVCIACALFAAGMEFGTSIAKERLTVASYCPRS
jgi:hypothetical protein